MTDYPLSGTYLMGRVYGKDGNVAKGAKLFPLPYETLLLSAESWSEELGYTDKNNLSSTVKAENPFAFSDQHGKLNLLSNDISSDKELKLVGSPVIVKPGETGHARSKKSIFFFPARLIYAYQSSHGNEWAKNLYEVLGQNSKKSSNLFKNSIKELDLNSSISELIHIPFDERKKLSAYSLYFKNYINWRDSIERLKSENTNISVLEVPQYYTIVVMFSSSKYEGSTVRLSDFPQGLCISGTESSATSIVEKVPFIDLDGEEKFSFCATFWIENDILSISNEIEQFCRINVDVKSVKNEAGIDYFESKGIDEYSLKERVFHLPIKTVIGRTAVVNGDPISVEESLLLQAPDLYQNFIKQLNKNPLALPQNVQTEKGGPTNKQAQLWHYLQTYKGFVDSSVMLLEKGATWQMLSKLTYAILSKAITGENSELARATLAAAGVAGAANGFISSVSNLKLNNASVARAKKIKNVMGTKVLNVVPMSDSLKPFISDAGKIAGVLLDKPLSLTTAGIAISKSVDSSNQLEKAEKFFSRDVLKYSLSTISPTENKLVALKNDAKLEEKEERALNLLKEQLKLMTISNTKGDHLSSSLVLNDTLFRVDSTTFGFDRATPNFTNKSIAIAFEKIGSLLSELTDPIDIIVSGHTCDIGTEKYNLTLSLERAEAVKSCILGAINNKNSALLPIWEPRIQVIGYGEHDNLVPNTSEENRAKNRRVDLLMKFSAQFDYPASRVALIEVEKSRKASIVASMNFDENVIGFTAEMASLAFDIIIGSIAKVYPMANVLLVVKSGLELIVTSYQELEKSISKESYLAKDILKLLSHVDMSIVGRFFNETGSQSHQTILMKSYLKRSLALNGLIRLIKKINYAQYNTDEDISVTDFDLEGYIKHYILDDSWELGEGILDPIHLDDVWLNVKQLNNTDGYIFPTLKTVIAGGRMVWNKSQMDDNGKLILEDARKSNKYFPIHYLAADSIENFGTVFASHIPEDIDKDIFKHVIMSVRAPDGEKWVEFKDYYQQIRERKLSPFDKIRILVIIDEDKADFELNDFINFPIVAEAVKVNYTNNVMGLETAVTEKIASTNTEYVHKINRKDLEKFELDQISEGDVWGVIIEPYFFYGVHQIFGTRPVVNYNDSTMMSLFSSKKSDKPNEKLIGSQKYLPYYYQIKVPERSKTKMRVCYDRYKTPHYNHGYIKSEFFLTLDPNREYQFVKDNGRYTTNLVKSDHIFHEKGFLENKFKGQSSNFVRVFHKPKVDLYLGQTNRKIGLNLNSEQNDLEKDDPLLSRRMLKGEIDNFDWNSSVYLTLIIRTKIVDGSKEQLINQKYDPNCIFLAKRSMVVEKMFSVSDYEFELEEINCIYRIGTIKVDESGSISFISAEYDQNDLPSKIDVLRSLYRKLSDEELKKHAVRNIFGGLETTEIWGNSSWLKYVNILGAKVEGLTPMIYPEELNIIESDRITDRKTLDFVRFSVNINGPVDSGLKNSKSNDIKLNGKPKKVPFNWYKPVSDESIEFAKKQIETNNNKENMSQEAEIFGMRSNVVKYNIHAHDVDPNISWVKSDPENIFEINDERRKLIFEWMNI
ncbi:OmpA family protein [Photobacterium sp. CCB-ST2H9]|uniref:OmpA family protein n=1 Tax=Photobacterium sp. CCB-ST2H9 TaxID=2912855 RepID=UPI0020052CAF|nr:OmpA family protein [Photobacterium sp. CCB-ST2H9]UTM59795.1 OmpA family protein [Photobacterium sp. CCB-ST2H9]